jgi:hypothetical protein
VGLERWDLAILRQKSGEYPMCIKHIAKKQMWPESAQFQTICPVSTSRRRQFCADAPRWPRPQHGFAGFVKADGALPLASAGSASGEA